MAHFGREWHSPYRYNGSIENCMMNEASREKIPWGFCFTRTEVRTVPRRPKRPCSHPGCPNLTDGRFCKAHQKEENKRYERYERDPAIKRRYGRAWKRIRDSYAASHPLCEECLKNGIYVPTEEIHHKLPLSQGGTHDRDNLIALCKSCHAGIHARNGDRWHNK